VKKEIKIVQIRGKKLNLLLVLKGQFEFIPTKVENIFNKKEQI